MPPRPRFTPDLILAAALALTREEGISTVTARSVAARLGCSTAPIFTHFASMEGLHEQLMEAIIAAFVAAASDPVDEDPLLGAGIGWLRFASDEPRLYEALFLTPHPWHAKWGPVRRELAQRMAAHPRYADLPTPARFALVGRASIVLHGLGVELWSGRLPASSPRRLLTELVLPVVEAAIARGWDDDLHSHFNPNPNPHIPRGSP